MKQSKEQMEWIRKLPLLKPEHKRKLREICERERTQLSALDERMGGKPAAVPKLHGVIVRNRTESKVEIVVPGYWFDENGDKHRRNASWNISPKKSSYLASKKERIHACKFLYQVKMNNRTYPSSDKYWIAYYSPDQGTVIRLDPKNFTQRHVTAKPVTGSGSTDPMQIVDDLLQIAEDVNDMKKAYDDNVKPIVSAIKKIRPKPSYHVRLESIEVAERKRDSRKWDTGSGEPDLVVRIKVKKFGGDSFDSGVVKDSYWHTFDESAVRAKLGQTIEISVHDDDAFNNDHIGTRRLEITKKLIKRGHTDLSFGQVESLVLRFSE